MINSNHRQIMEIFRIAFVCKCIHREDIIKWADEMLLREGDYDFVELSMSGNLPYKDFESLLLKIARRSNHFQSLRIVLGRMAFLIEQGQNLHRDFAAGLDRFVVENGYQLPDDLTFLIGIDDDYSLADKGIIGSVDDLNAVFYANLKRFKSKQSALSNWYSAALQSSR